MLCSIIDGIIGLEKNGMFEMVYSQVSSSREGKTQNISGNKNIKINNWEKIGSKNPTFQSSEIAFI